MAAVVCAGADLSTAFRLPPAASTSQRSWPMTVCASSPLSLMSETIAIANACGHNLPTAIALEQIKQTRTMGKFKPSTLIDHLAGRPLEIEPIWGEPLRRGQAKGIGAPQLAKLVSVSESRSIGRSENETRPVTANLRLQPPAQDCRRLRGAGSVRPTGIALLCALEGHWSTSLDKWTSSLSQTAESASCTVASCRSQGPPTSSPSSTARFSLVSKPRSARPKLITHRWITSYAFIWFMDCCTCKASTTRNQWPDDGCIGCRPEFLLAMNRGINSWMVDSRASHDMLFVSVFSGRRPVPIPVI